MGGTGEEWKRNPAEAKMVRGKTWNVERSDLASALQTCGKPRLTIIKKRIILYAKFKVHRVKQETTKLIELSVHSGAIGVAPMSRTRGIPDHDHTSGRLFSHRHNRFSFGHNKLPRVFAAPSLWKSHSQLLRAALQYVSFDILPAFASSKLPVDMTGDLSS